MRSTLWKANQFTIPSSPRFIEFDVWRGLAIIGMIVFHVVFFLDFLSIWTTAYDNGAWHILARSVQLSFLLLVGIGMQLSYQKILAEGGRKIDFLKRNIRRGMLVFCAALLVTLVSALVIPESFIRFGILHLIGVSIILLGFIVNFPRFTLLVSILIYLLSFPISMTIVSDSPLLMLGFRVQNFYTLDYFPIFPWMAVPAVGIWLGHILLKGYRRQYPAPIFLESSLLAGVLARFGKYSLLIYLIHMPIIIGVLLVWQKFFS